MYLISDNFGAFVAVDDEYSALIPKKELFGDVREGQKIHARIIEIRDGRHPVVELLAKEHPEEGLYSDG